MPTPTKVRGPEAARIQAQLTSLDPAAPVQVMFSGHPYFGPAGQFAGTASWGAILVTPDERPRFLGLLNEVSDRSEDIKDEPAYLTRWLGPAPSSLRRAYGELIPAMEYARRELSGSHYQGMAGRGYHPGHATTWLRYVTFRFRPSVPDALEAFLADSFNREEILAAYIAGPGQWHCAVRIELHVTSSEALLLDLGQAQWVPLSA